MIVVTGSAGFIGSCMVAKLNQEGFNDVVLVDDFSKPEKNKNFEGKTFSQKVDRSKFIEWIGENHKFIFVLDRGHDRTCSKANLAFQCCDGVAHFVPVGCYRRPGKGQLDWRQLIEALKLYDYKGMLSIHLDDEFIDGNNGNLEESLDGEDWRPDLMRHVGQKRRFQSVGFFSFLNGNLKLMRSLYNKLFKMRPVLFKFRILFENFLAHLG